MRILYLSGSYIPSRRASSMHVMRMCAALARQGHRVTLVSKLCAPRQESRVDDDFAFYGVEPNFRMVKLPRPHARGGELRYQWGISRLLAADTDSELLYCRDPLAAWQVARRGLPLVFESHDLPAGPAARMLHRQMLGAPSFRRLVVISAALRERYEELDLLPPRAETIVAHDAAEPLTYCQAPTELNGRPPRLGYVGHLYKGRGIEILAGLAALMPRCEVHVVGGSSSDLARWRRAETPANLIFHGFVAPGRLAELYGGFDILLMPYQRRLAVASGRAETSDWMSPMKLFEYMATGRPIVSSDLPVLREILAHERNALLVPPADPVAWAAALDRLLEDRSLRRRLGQAARRDLETSHTWDRRARAVLANLEGPS